MSFIDPNSPEFKAGVKVGRILRRILFWSGVGLTGYFLGKHSNKNSSNAVNEVLKGGQYND